MFVDSRAEGRDCQHGQLRRSCPICEAERDLQSLAHAYQEVVGWWRVAEARNRALEQELARLQQQIETLTRSSSTLTHLIQAANKAEADNRALVEALRGLVDVR